MKISRREFLKVAGVGIAGILGAKLGFGTDEIRIGHQVDLSGPLAIYGYWQDKALKAAVSKVNQEGGIAGRPVRLFVEDTETNPDVGLRKLRRLILQDEVDFVIGSQHSGVSIASLPAALELETVYFPLGEATKITAELKNDYIFKPNHTVMSHIQVAYRWALQNLGKRWTIVVADYAFGLSHAKDWPSKIREMGGEVIDIITIPLGAVDFIPYLGKIDRRRTEVLLFVFPGAGAVRFIDQAAGLGLLKELKFFGVICSIDGIEVTEPLEGTWYVSNHPRLHEEVPDELKPFDAALREAVGVDHEGREIGGDKVVTASHYWYAWTALFLIKKAVEESGWRSKRDNPLLIEALEGMEVKASYGFPQGDLFIRAEDHQAFHDHYIEQVKDGKLRVILRFPKEEAIY
jgi:branched-chain amino acid transport system substrate-binding protein